MHFLIPLKDLLEQYYIDELSNQLGVNKDDVSYINSERIEIRGVLLSDYLKGNNTLSPKKIFTNAENRINKFLKEQFKCERNKDVEGFLHNSSILFQKRNISRTYLIMSGTMILGYFSLAMKVIILQEKPNAKFRKFLSVRKHKNNDDSEIEYINTFLIGQIGRNDDCPPLTLTLSVFMDEILNIISATKALIGGSAIIVEVENIDKLIKKYEESGFKYLQQDQSQLSQLFQYSLDY